MESLYHLSEQMHRLYDLEFEVDKNTGEISKEFSDTLESYQGLIEDKAVDVAAFIRNLECQIDAIRKAISDMQWRKASLENKLQYLKKYLLENLQKNNINQVTKSPYFAIKIKKCPEHVDIVDESKIPERYITTETIIERTIDKEEIRKDLRNNIVVDGCELKRNYRLEIK